MAAARRRRCRRALEGDGAAYADGRARAIGVSYFQKHHLERLFAETEVAPAANQLEVRPYRDQNRCAP
ncbi:hypothetical protein EF294_10625 [Gordonia oryzae]|uniref:Uncharacterized protein n=1 Tax=Gordonia oryzae TaxID=2487349 RepID=A0A3N4GI92_9ACTN|nr:hypothetical protein EF294_10625 [Gordonia oryzae]